MKLDFLQSVPLEETGEKLPICARLSRLCLSGQEVVVRIFGVALLDNVHEQRRYGYRSRGCLCLWRSYMKIGCAFLLVVDTLDGFVDADGLVSQRDVFHL